MKQQNTMDEKWKYLIVLDACRFDYFKYNYELYFHGCLEPRKSPAQWTLDWLTKTFTESYDDISYISPMPMIRSTGPTDFHDHYFDAPNTFKKIVDVWDTHWDDTIHTVPAYAITKAARKYMLHHLKDRLVIHYLQPHAPYVKFNQNHQIQLRERKNKTNKVKKNKLKNMMTKIVQHTTGNILLYHVNNILGIPPFTPIESTWRMVNKESSTIQWLYKQNVMYVLPYVKQLIDYLPPGKMIVTADHGELLGERGNWGHGGMKPAHPMLTTVPWLEVKRNHDV